jgi:Tol biopolymer transport system component
MNVGTELASMTPDGQNVAWSSGGPLYIWNAQAAGNTYTNSQVTAASIVAMSPDGTRIAAYNSSFIVVDATAQTNFSFPAPNPVRPGAQFSSDGRYLAYVSGTGLNQDQIYVYDFQTGTNLLVSAKL